MKMNIVFAFFMILLGLAETVQAQAITKEKSNMTLEEKQALHKVCSQPLDENSKSDVVCDPSDTNLTNRRSSSIKTEAGSPEAEDPRTCRECELARTQGRLGDKTAAPAKTAGSTSSGKGSDAQK